MLVTKVMFVVCVVKVLPFFCQHMVWHVLCGVCSEELLCRTVAWDGASLLAEARATDSQKL